MIEKDKLEFGKIMAVMQKIYIPGKPIEKTIVQIYFETLEELTIEQFHRAIKTVLKTKKYSTFPLPAEILEAARLDENRDPELDAQKAWVELLEICDKMGFDEPMIEDQTLRRTVRVAFGSVKKFGALSTGADAMDRNYFISAYKRIAAQSSRDRDRFGTLGTKQLPEIQKKLTGHTSEALEKK